MATTSTLARTMCVRTHSVRTNSLFSMPLLDTWYSHIQNIKTLLDILNMKGSKDRVRIAIGKILNGIFQILAGPNK